MDNWQSKIDREIQKAINDGDMSDAPGAGKPLDLDNDPYTPDEMKMAFKVLRDNAVLPDWIMEGCELDELQEQLLRQIAAAVRSYQGALGDAKRATGAKLHALRHHAEAAWKRAQSTISEDVIAFNKRTNALNLKLPPGLKHRPPLNVDREIEKALKS